MKYKCRAIQGAEDDRTRRSDLDIDPTVPSAERERTSTDNYYGDLARQRGDAYALMVACDEIDKLRYAFRQLAQDVLRCIPADWKPNMARYYSNLGLILAEYIDDLRTASAIEPHKEKP